MPPQAQNYISGCENFLLRVVLSKTDTPTPSSQYLSIMQLKLLMTPSPLLQMMYQVSTDPEELCAKPPCYAKGSLTWGL